MVLRTLIRTGKVGLPLLWLITNAFGYLLPKMKLHLTRMTMILSDSSKHHCCLCSFNIISTFYYTIFYYICRTRESASTSYRIDTSPLSGHWSPGSSRSVEFSPDSTRMYSPPPLHISCSPTSSALSPASQSSPPSPLSDAYSPVCGYSSSEDEKPDDTDAEIAVECEVDSDCEVTSPHL